MKRIQILGTGCKKCRALTENAEQAAKELGFNVSIEKVEKLQDIMEFGVMLTPALAVDGEIKAEGKLLTPDEVKQLLA